MVTLGVVSGVGLAAWQARRMGLDPEVIFSLAFWVFAFGILGARTFFVIQYWEEFNRETVWQTLLAIANFPKGGLVVYGSVLGGLAALFVYCKVRKLPLLAIGDLIAPGMLVGLVLGRVGCLLNGCCFGGLCEDSSFPAIRFPQFADAYEHQRSLGLLHGIRLGPDADGRPAIVEVQRNSPAGCCGLKPGQVVKQMELEPLAAMNAAVNIEELAGGEVGIELSSGETINIPNTLRELETPTTLGSTEIGFALEQSGVGDFVLVETVTPGGLADQAGLRPGQFVASIRLSVAGSFEAARRVLMYAGTTLVLTTVDGTRHDVSVDRFPPCSRPVHPTQIYSTIKAGLLAFFLWSYYPFRRRDGEVFALMVTIYPLFRILLEMLRDDVPGLFGTSITISQAVSGLILLSGIGLWIILFRWPLGSVLPVKPGEIASRSWSMLPR